MLLECGSLTLGERTFIAKRIFTIEGEVAAIGDLHSSRELTEAGRRLVAALRRRSTS